MNRNLIIAIAAVVIVGVAAGVLLLGNGQAPPLPGAIGPISTNLTLTVSGCADADASGNRGFAIFGVLRDSAGNGLADRTIALRTAKCDNGTCGVLGVEFGATDPLGGFSFVKNEPATPDYDADTYVYYGAAFSGDEKYAGCASALVNKTC
jgi:hypothetical protein